MTAVAARTALFTADLAGGGAERIALRLADRLSADMPIDLVLCRLRGERLAAVPVGVRVFALPPAGLRRSQFAAWRADPAGLASLPYLLRHKPSPWLRHLPGLIAYLRAQRPARLLSFMTEPNLLALWAVRHLRRRPRVVISERNHLSRQLGEFSTGRWLRLPAAVRRNYPRADAVVAVSSGVARDLADLSGLPPARICTILNPVVGAELESEARRPVAHAWFAPGAPPVVLAAGRLHRQKDFALLLRAFARLPADRPERLVILGEGPQRAALEALRERLGLRQRVDLPGWVADPAAWMARAALFVLSSAHEGLPSVLVEAMACGCPVVSTDCPSGPRDILDHGRLGPLVAPGDAAALAQAMQARLQAPRDSATLRAAALRFAEAARVADYRRVLDGGRPAQPAAG